MAAANAPIATRVEHERQIMLSRMRSHKQSEGRERTLRDKAWGGYEAQVRQLRTQGEMLAQMMDKPEGPDEVVRALHQLQKEEQAMREVKARLARSNQLQSASRQAEQAASECMEWVKMTKGHTVDSLHLDASDNSPAKRRVVRLQEAQKRTTKTNRNNVTRHRQGYQALKQQEAGAIDDARWALRCKDDEAQARLEEQKTMQQRSVQHRRAALRTAQFHAGEKRISLEAAEEEYHLQGYLESERMRLAGAQYVDETRLASAREYQRRNLKRSDDIQIGLERVRRERDASAYELEAGSAAKDSAASVRLSARAREVQVCIKEKAKLRTAAQEDVSFSKEVQENTDARRRRCSLMDAQHHRWLAVQRVEFDRHAAKQARCQTNLDDFVAHQAKLSEIRQQAGLEAQKLERQVLEKYDLADSRMSEIYSRIEDEVAKRAEDRDASISDAQARREESQWHVEEERRLAFEYNERYREDNARRASLSKQALARDTSERNLDALLSHRNSMEQLRSEDEFLAIGRRQDVDAKDDEAASRLRARDERVRAEKTFLHDSTEASLLDSKARREEVDIAADEERRLTAADRERSRQIGKMRAEVSRQASHCERVRENMARRMLHSASLDSLRGQKERALAHGQRVLVAQLLANAEDAKIARDPRWPREEASFSPDSLPEERSFPPEEHWQPEAEKTPLSWPEAKAGAPDPDDDWADEL